MLKRQLLRFVLAGAANTAFTLVIYWLLLPHMEFAWAYTLSFIVGIFSGYALNTYMVFHAQWSWVRLLAFPSIQLVNYLVGLGIVWVVVRILAVDERIAPVIATVVNIPLNFLLTRWLIGSRPRRHE